MKYSIFHDFEDDGYYVVNNCSKEYASEIKVYESDSLHDCFIWAYDNNKHLYSDLHDEEVWCVYWGDFSENYYMCPERIHIILITMNVKIKLKLKELIMKIQCYMKSI